jgi:hypothetical protein
VSSTERALAGPAARGVQRRIIGIAGIVALSGCSFGMASIDARQVPSAEPTCSAGTVTLDRVIGASLVIAGSSTLSANQNEAGLEVTSVTIGAALVYLLAASVGARRYAECEAARTRWAYSNAIKARSPAPRRAGAPPAAARPPGNARPWADGVSEREQAVAIELYSAGNREFVENRHVQALAKYREAIRHWDHPAIRFNIAVSLISLDQLVEARDNLERSLAHGAAALGADAYAQALTQRTLLDGKLARLTLDCPEPNEEVMIDGKLVFKGPGTVEQFLLPGEHQVVATKPGSLPASRKIVLVAGASAAFEIRPLVDPRP